MESAAVQRFREDLQKITEGRTFGNEGLTAEHYEDIHNLVQQHLEKEAEKTTGGFVDEAARSRAFSSPSLSLSSLKHFLVWEALHALFGKNVAEVKTQWSCSKQVKIDINNLEAELEKYGLGMGAVMLYYCDGDNNDDDIISYVINGMTKSRFSHATMIMPVPHQPPGLWQSAYAIAGLKLGGGDLRKGPDMADLQKLMIKYKSGWPTSRFVFRPLKTPLTHAQQGAAHDFVHQTIKDPNMTFPSIPDLYWSWILANHPELAYIAKLCGHDDGVVDDKYTFMFCSMLCTNTLLHAGVLSPPIKAPQFSPGDYGLPYNKVAPNDALYGEEYEFIFDVPPTPQN